MRLAVDADLCTGHGRCYALAPAVLSFDDEGYVTIRGDSVDVPEEHLAAIENAVASCPEQAMELQPG